MSADSWRAVQWLEDEADACVAAARRLRQASDTPAQRINNERSAARHLEYAARLRDRAAAMIQRLNQRRIL